MAGKQAFFYEKRGASHAKKHQKPNHATVRWVDVIQTLVAGGHDFMAIQGYTERQIELFYQSIVRQQNSQKADQIEAVNLGFNGSKETDKYLQQLRNS